VSGAEGLGVSDAFEVVEEDLLGRVGRLYTPHGVVETPELAPVINPVRNVLPPSRVAEVGFSLLVTNAYIIRRRYGDLALRMGVHGLLGVEKPVMTDSGAYQLMEYRSVDVDPVEIVKYQERLGSDIGVILDIPTRYGAPRRVVEAEVRETVRRAKLSLEARERDDMILVGPVQGGTHLDLVAWSARELSKMGFEMYGIGGPTQIMEQYRYEELVDLIATAKSHLPPERPVHLFGAGNPMMLSLAVALGVDTFDSASYAHYARDLRYMLSDGVVRVERLRDLPCSCPVCRRYDVETFLSLPREELEREIALHNLYVIRAELRRIRQAIHEGTLWELLELRARSHPSLLQALYRLRKYAKLLERGHPATKPTVRGRFYYPTTSAWRPEVLRHVRRLLSNYEPPSSRCLLLLPETEEKPFSRYGPISILASLLRSYVEEGLVHVVVYAFPFGPIPLELDDVYPLSQYERPRLLPLDDRLRVAKLVAAYARRFRGAYEWAILHRDVRGWGAAFYRLLLRELRAALGAKKVSVTPVRAEEPYSSLAMRELLGEVRRLASET